MPFDPNQEDRFSWVKNSMESNFIMTIGTLCTHVLFKHGLPHAHDSCACVQDDAAL